MIGGISYAALFSKKMYNVTDYGFSYVYDLYLQFSQCCLTLQCNWFQLVKSVN